MNSPLCSVLIPSRWRYEQLVRSIDSWLKNTHEMNNLEIIVRLHESDSTSYPRLEELIGLCPKIVKVVAGRDRVFPEEHNWLWNQIRDQATGVWHQYWSDDMILKDKGVHWDELLSSVPTTGFIVQPEFHNLGGSVHANLDAGPAPFVPSKCLEAFGYNEIPEPPDIALNNILRKNGWRTHILPGIEVFHDRYQPGDFEKQVTWAKSIPSDIGEHVPALIEYGKAHDSITEFGVRDAVSTVAWLASTPKKLTCYDRNIPTRLNDLAFWAREQCVQFKFIQQDTRTVRISETDLLFIDTTHDDQTLRLELWNNQSSVGKTIILHDTELFGWDGENGGLGIRRTLMDFLLAFPAWRVERHFTNCAG